MARIRTIKPEFWTSAQVFECSMNARLLFIGLWNFADDKGRHPWRQKQIKAQIFPADPLTENDIQGMLLELSKNGLITKYTVDNQEYFTIDGWHHQRIDKPQPPKYPAPLQDHSKNVPGTFPPDRIVEDRIGGKGEVAPIEPIAVTSEAQEVAEWLHQKAVEKTPNINKPNIKIWTDVIAYMMHEGKTPEDIKDVAEWAMQQEIWGRNPITPSFLNDKWDKLITQKAASKTTKPAASAPVGAAYKPFPVSA